MSLFLALAFLAMPTPLTAGEPSHKSFVELTTQKPLNPFEKGVCEVNFMAGASWSPVLRGKDRRPGFDYAKVTGGVGWMLTDPGKPGFWRGNWETFITAFASSVIAGPGSYLAGGRGLLRYNFVQPETRWVPFVDIGAGVLRNDAYKDSNQLLIGGEWAFSLQAQGGVRFFVSPRWALIAATQFEHISNAGLYSRNVGVNSLGGTLGVASFF
jgi:hypothetical protein